MSNAAFSPGDDALLEGAISPELGCRIILDDPHVNGQCRRCFYQVADLSFSIGTFVQCPNCLRERIEALLTAGAPCEGELAAMYRAALADVAEQDDTFFGCLRVDLPEFCRCAGCDRLLRADEAWTSSAPGYDEGEPYCGGCTGVA